MNSIKSARSASFFKPANTIFVPGMYFFGLMRYSYICLSDQVMPEVLFASEYGNPSSVPEGRPKMPHKFGPCLLLPPLSIVWHWAHFALKSLAPFFSSPAGTVTSGSALPMLLDTWIVNTETGLVVKIADTLLPNYL